MTISKVHLLSTFVTKAPSVSFEHELSYLNRRQRPNRQPQDQPTGQPGKYQLAEEQHHRGPNLSLKKHHYVVFISRNENGQLQKLPVPMKYVYIFMTAAIIGMFTITGLAGSYSRMLIKTEAFNQLRAERDSTRQNNAKLQQQLNEKNVQVASLGSLATEVSALYGLTTSKLSLTHGKAKAVAGPKGADVATAPVSNEDDYYSSLNNFMQLRETALSGVMLHPTLLTTTTLSGFDVVPTTADLSTNPADPSLWPVMGRITSGFGDREDPITGNGEGEFHRGIDISAANGTPVRATADGTVISAQMENGYGREITLDHGHGLKTLYGHLSGFNCIPGQQVLRGQVIGFVGHSGRVTGAHLHYEVRIHDSPVNPHKYLLVTLAQVDGMSESAGQ